MSACVVLPVDCTTLSLEYVRQFDALITDPPFSPHVHSNAVSATAGRGVSKREFGFDHLDDATRDWLCRAAANVKRWSVIYSDIESTHLLRDGATRYGATYVRTLAWIRWSMAQLQGDRPPQGREDLVVFHRGLTLQELADIDQFCFHEFGVDVNSGQDPVRDVALFYGCAKGGKAWNGPGNLTHLSHTKVGGSNKRKHRAQKPLDQALDLVSWFTNLGELVLDSHCGRGTIPLACSLLGRVCVGCDRDPVEARLAAARVVGPLSEQDLEDVRCWLEPKDYGDVVTGATGPIKEAARQADRARLLADPRITPFAAKLLKAA